MNLRTVAIVAAVGLIIGVGAAVAVQLYYPSAKTNDNHNGEPHMAPSILGGKIGVSNTSRTYSTFSLFNRNGTLIPKPK